MPISVVAIRCKALSTFSSDRTWIRFIKCNCKKKKSSICFIAGFFFESHQFILIAVTHNVLLFCVKYYDEKSDLDVPSVNADFFDWCNAFLNKAEKYALSNLKRLTETSPQLLIRKSQQILPAKPIADIVCKLFDLQRCPPRHFKRMTNKLRLNGFALARWYPFTVNCLFEEAPSLKCL